MDYSTQRKKYKKRILYVGVISIILIFARIFSILDASYMDNDKDLFVRIAVAIIFMSSLGSFQFIGYPYASKKIDNYFDKKEEQDNEKV